MMELIPYSPERFDAGYYERGERGGFTGYSWDNPEQQRQLALKWDCIPARPYKSILFVGCGKGFEVRYFNEHGKHANGIDVSKYAIDHADPVASAHMRWYDGREIPFDDNAFDVVAAFDVLTLVPEPSKLVNEMVRVARKQIVIRSIVKSWNNWNEAIDGCDGVTFHYLPFHFWDHCFTYSGKFKFDGATIAPQHEAVMRWIRNGPQ